MTDFVVVIPSRYASERLPGKPLRLIGGKPMLQHVYERGIESSAAEVVIATDDERIAAAAQSSMIDWHNRSFAVAFSVAQLSLITVFSCTTLPAAGRDVSDRF